jgi:hypothetical protein
MPKPAGGRVQEHGRSGLTQTLEALEGGVEVVATSRYEPREGIISAGARKGDTT